MKLSGSLTVNVSQIGNCQHITMMTDTDFGGYVCYISPYLTALLISFSCSSFEDNWSRESVMKEIEIRDKMLKSKGVFVFEVSGRFTIDGISKRMAECC